MIEDKPRWVDHSEDINRVNIAGRVRRWKKRYTGKNTAQLWIEIITENKAQEFKDGYPVGEWKSELTVHHVECWGDRAEGLAPKMRYGLMLAIEGRLRTKQRDKGPMYTSVLMQRIVFFEDRPKPAADGGGGESTSR